MAARPQTRLQLVGTDGALAERRAISVLYVEDDDDDLYVLRRQIHALPSFRVELAHAPSVDAARAMTAHHRFDVVLCDFWLGSETTIPLIDALKAAPAPVPVVLVSSLENDDIELIGRRAGAAGFVAKADLSAAALDRIFTTLLPAEEAVAAPDPAPARPAGGAAPWLRAILRSVEAVRAGSRGKGPDAALAEAVVADILAAAGSARDALVETLAGLERATRSDAWAPVRFDAVPHLTDAVRRLDAEGAGGTVRYHPPAVPILVEASPALFGDLLQGVFAEAAAPACAGASLTVAPLIRDGALHVEIIADDGRRGPAGPVASEAGAEGARVAAAADARRLLVETLAAAMGGALAFEDADPRTAGGRLVARLVVPLRAAA